MPRAPYRTRQTMTPSREAGCLMMADVGILGSAEWWHAAKTVFPRRVFRGEGN